MLSAIAAASAVLALASAPAGAEPAPMPTTRTEAQTQAEQAQAAVDALVAQVTEQQAALDEINARVESAGQTYAYEQQRLAQAQSDEDAAVLAAKPARDAFDIERDRLVEVLRSQYILGRPSSVAAVIGAASEHGAVAQLRTTEMIADHQAGVVDDYNEAMSGVAAAEAVTSAALHRQATAVSAANEALIAAAADREKAAAIEADLSARLAAAQLDRRTSQTALNLLAGRRGPVGPAIQSDLNNRYRQMLADAGDYQIPDASGGWTPEAGQAAVLRALRWIGTPYAWAGGGYSGPTRGTAVDAATANDGNVIGFDCSGLVMLGWAPYLSLPHLASEQYAVAGSMHPSIGELQPGDLVFWGTSRNIHHVAIYVGDGNVVEAPYSGGTVRVVPLDAVATDYFGATRPLS